MCWSTSVSDEFPVGAHSVLLACGLAPHSVAIGFGAIGPELDTRNLNHIMPSVLADGRNAIFHGWSYERVLVVSATLVVGICRGVYFLLGGVAGTQQDVAFLARCFWAGSSAARLEVFARRDESLRPGDRSGMFAVGGLVCVRSRRG